ncbi:MAG: hypothetical protein AB2A00_11185 [Myxococcota bacterium]
MIAVLGLGVAAPLALLPLALGEAGLGTQVLGLPVSVVVTGALVGAVLVAALVTSAVVQRVVRPLLGPQRSVQGAALGALFFGGMATVVGLAAGFVVVTTPFPGPLSSVRREVFGSNYNNRPPHVVALMGAVMVALAVPIAALGASVGGQVSAEIADAALARSSTSATTGQSPAGQRL